MKEYLVAYDYGQGAVWAFVRASSAGDIKKQLPHLEVLQKAPGWMSKEDLLSIKKRMSFDLDDARRRFFDTANASPGRGRRHSEEQMATSGSRRIYRSARTGRFVTKASAKRNPKSTVSQVVQGNTATRGQRPA